MSGRLGILGALHRPKTLNPLKQANNECGLNAEDSSTSASASYSKLERKLKAMKAENVKLKNELNDAQIALKQLFSENSHEKLDERRINLLKFQIIQLERQIAMMNEALGCRQTSLLEVENSMVWLADKLRSFIAEDVKGPLVPIARSDLISMTEVLESSRLKLFKSLEDSNKEKVGIDLMFLNPFLGGKYKPNEQLSLLDISIQRMDYINLRHLAHLESKLCNLYKELIQVYECLHYIEPKTVFDRHVNCVEKNRLETLLLGASVMLKDSADDIMALSFLCPSSPWPALKRPLVQQVPIDRVISALPPLPHNKQEEVTHIIEASLRVSNHHNTLLTKEIDALKEELTFHRSVHDFQMQYTHALFDAVRTGYREFEASARSLISKPLSEVLDAYKHLKNTASEDAFKDLLMLMKNNEEQLTSVVEALTCQDFESDESGSAAFSKFEEEFINKINLLVKKCQNERDLAMKTNKIIQKEQDKKNLLLQTLIENLEAKYEKMWIPKTNVRTKTKQLSDENDADRNQQHGVSSIKDNSQFVQDRDPKYSETSSASIKHKNEIISQIEQSESLISKSENKNTSMTGESCLSESNLNGTKCRDKNSGLGKKFRWKPDKEWVSDLSVQSDTLSSHVDADIEDNSGETACHLNREHTINWPQKTNNLSIEKKPTIKSKNKIKKTLTYEPKLSVANRTLKLKPSGNLSKSEVVELTDDSSLSKKDLEK